MIKVYKNADIYAPAHLGQRDILVCGGTITAVESTLDVPPDLRYVEVVDLQGAAVVPGYMDGHVHVSGGGGEQGPSSLVPECKLSEMVSAGVTTVVGLLGTNCVSRTLENTLAKVRSLEEGGITAYMLTGSYSIPSPTLTGSVMRDMVLIDKVIGAKVALSDHRSPAPTVEELARLFSEARVGGMVGGKAGVTVVHIGRGKSGLRPLLQAAELSDCNLSKILPTHCGRNDALFQEALDYTRQGGNIDLTAGRAAKRVSEALESGVDIAHITISSDGYGSQPVFNEQMECVGMTYTSCSVLHEELRSMVEAEGIPVETALAAITSNVAARFGLAGKKGIIAPGADADLVIWNDAMEIRAVYAKGKLAYQNGCAAIKGRFE